jgi:hypothetical protein
MTDKQAHAKVILGGLEKVTAESGGGDEALTPGDIRLRGLLTVGKGLGLIVLGGVLVAGMVALGIKGGDGLGIVVLVPTLFLGAARVASGLASLLSGRPWERASFWLKLPLMFFAAVLAFGLVLVTGAAIR